MSGETRAETTARRVLSQTSIRQIVEDVRGAWRNVGMAIAVVRGHEVLFCDGFGVCQWGDDTANDANTLFQIGSTTKAFTAAAVGVLVDRGALTWDDPISNHVPDFQLSDPWLTRNVTIRDALCHRSGVVGSYFPSLALSSADQVIRQARYVKIEGAFRACYRYSNLMYAVVGRLIERASSRRWADFIREELLEPLNMARSTTSPYDCWDAEWIAPTFLGAAPAAASPNRCNARAANIAMPHVRDEQDAERTLSWQSYDNAAAAGALVSSAADMVPWLMCNLHKGESGGHRLIEEPTLREIHRTQNLHIDTSQYPFDTVGERYALGWRRTRYRGLVHLSHGGGMIGFPVYVTLIPEEKLGVAVLANSAHMGGAAFHKAISFSIVDRAVNASIRDWSSELIARARAVQQQARDEDDQWERSRLLNSPPSLPLERYLGTYEDSREGSGPVTITENTSGLALRFAGHGAFSANLSHWHGDIFRLMPPIGVRDVLGGLGQRFVRFEVGPAGSPTALWAFNSRLDRTSQPATA